MNKNGKGFCEGSLLEGTSIGQTAEALMHGGSGD
jgi:hypothetical protein